MFRRLPVWTEKIRLDRICRARIAQDGAHVVYLCVREVYLFRPRPIPSLPVRDICNKSFVLHVNRQIMAKSIDIDHDRTAQAKNLSSTEAIRPQEETRDVQHFAYTDKRKLGIWGSVFLILNKMIGTGSKSFIFLAASARKIQGIHSDSLLHAIGHFRRHRIRWRVSRSLGCG
jgi:hypothetical protein